MQTHENEREMPAFGFGLRPLLLLVVFIVVLRKEVAEAQFFNGFDLLGGGDYGLGQAPPLYHGYSHRHYHGYYGNGIAGIYILCDDCGHG